MSETTFNFADVDNTLEFDLPTPEADEIISEKTEEAKPEEEQEKEDDGVSQEDKDLFLEIYDAMMFEDHYEKEYKLGKRYSIVLSTRSSDADLGISRQLDSMNFQTMHAMQNMAGLLTLSHCLMEFNGKDLRSMSVRDRYDYVRNKSSHVIERLVQHMLDFDNLVRQALMYGELNF